MSEAMEWMENGKRGGDKKITVWKINELKKGIIYTNYVLYLIKNHW